MILNINWVVHTVTQSDYSALIAIWEGAVRATHDFLPEEDIAELKSLILQHYFDAVDLRCIKSSSGEMIGFCGVHAGNIEMLFVSPASVNIGIGRALTEYAISAQQATKVDVNEQNPKALGFYQCIGFKVVGRSELDGQGKSYPLLHLAL
ncbi:GNAT family N-acetyltransferase [Paraglaciecola chathamensis]|uniref:GNAT family N-acetyltransferase n=1 Tax=Paraglaciecola chathamensis TaxID=368405 RepID=UPI0026FA8D72|nr:GNAT family N-acetyltransferase [Paraglaciecola chathamensis]MDO6839687.1 GNAT family N-acetyltransferase [Paraglaciecola chathamensis]